MKQRESNLMNDMNRIEKRLISETDYSKNLESKLTGTQKELKSAQEQNDKMQKTLEEMKITHELDNIELQRKFKSLEREKEEVMQRENTSVKVKISQLVYLIYTLTIMISSRTHARLNILLYFSAECRRFVQKHASQA